MVGISLYILRANESLSIGMVEAGQIGLRFSAQRQSRLPIRCAALRPAVGADEASRWALRRSNGIGRPRRPQPMRQRPSSPTQWDLPGIPRLFEHGRTSSIRTAIRGPVSNAGRGCIDDRRNTPCFWKTACVRQSIAQAWPDSIRGAEFARRDASGLALL